MVNPVEFVGGAGLGTALGLLCEAIRELIRKNHMFSPLLKEIQSTLDSLAPLIAQMSQSNQQLPYAKPDELQGLEAVLKDGTVLLEKCNNFSRWNIFWKRYKYSNRLLGWKEKFEKQSIVQMQMARDVKAIGIGVQTIEATTKKIEDSAVTTEVSTGKIEVSVGNLTEEVETIKISTKKIEVSTENLEVSVGNLTEEVKNMKVEVNQTIKENSGIQDQSALFKAWSAVPEPPPHPVGLDVPLDELKKKLFGDDGLSKLVLTGPGGCGKTTLASKFCRDKEVKDKFKDNIFFVTISKDPKMDLIVQQLYQQKGEKAPAFTNEEGAAILLPKILKEEGKSPLLLVLDDVWSESHLATFDLGMTDYKVLVTSRSQLEGFGSTHVVHLLDKKNAMELFRHSASLGDKSSHISEDVARQIVGHCGGFPLALKLVGESLSGKPEAFWRARVIEWSRGSSSIFDPEIQLLRCLQSSIDKLDKEVTGKCFLDLSSFPQNKYIPVATLFDMWAELHNLNEDDLCIKELYELNTRSLANPVDKREVMMEANGYYSQHFVIQHDLIRELAIYLSREDKKAKDRKRLMIKICGENHPKWWKKHKCQTMQARLFSISTDEKFSMKWPNIQLPKAKVLVLFFQRQDYVLPEFVERMHNLKVLVITYDGYYDLGAALSGFQPLKQLSNLKTIILEGISIPSITRNPMVLESVKKISLSRCYKVCEAFRDDSVKISDFFPKLEVMNIDFCNLVELPADLGYLTLLRELNITNCCGLSTLPEGMEKLVNLEVLRLRFCRDFSNFQHSIITLQRLKSLDLAYCSSIQELPKYIGELSSLRELNTRNCPRLNELPRSMSNLKQLEVVICSSKTKLLTEALSHAKNISMVAPTLSWDDFNISMVAPTVSWDDLNKSMGMVAPNLSRDEIAQD